jgi:hypothetical protein
MWPLAPYFDYYRTHNFQYMRRITHLDLSRLAATRHALSHGTRHVAEETWKPWWVSVALAEVPSRNLPETNKAECLTLIIANIIKNITHLTRLTIIKKTPWSGSASELYRPSDRRLSAKWLPTCADSRCHVVSVTDPSGRILGFLVRSRYFSIK